VKERYLIIGAGLTGLSAAYHLRRDFLVLEKEKSPGGLCRTIHENGFFFDHSGHLIHLRNEYTKSLVPSLLKNNFAEHRRMAYIQYDSCKVPFPFQANLSSLPRSVNRECLIEFIDAYCRGKNAQIRSFQDWVMTHLGGGLARHFFVPYNRKLYGAYL
jgi:protoporphyrinogen oxidase